MTVIYVTLVGLVSLGALYELYCAFQRVGVRPSLWTGTLALVAFFVMAGMNVPLLALMGAVNVYLVVSLAQHLGRKNATGTLTDWVFSTGGVLYVGFTMMHLVLITRIEGGVEAGWVETGLRLFGAGGTALGLAWLCVVLATTWTTEVIVATAGRLRPAVTRGVIAAGVIAGTVVGGASGYLVGLPAPPAVMFLAGAMIAAGAVVGGLCESMIKRQLGLPGYGRLVPGRGGFLDRIAALRVTAPLTFYLAAFVQWQT